jgi:hypothetical protein
MNASILSAAAGEFKDEGFKRGIDNLGPENVGGAERFNPLVAFACHT